MLYGFKNNDMANIIMHSFCKMNKYGHFKGIIFYKNFWILIIQFLPEAYWCKFYLNHTFIRLLQSLYQTGSMKTLLTAGKILSFHQLYTFYQDTDNISYWLGQSNLPSIKRYISIDKGFWEGQEHLSKTIYKYNRDFDPI